MKKALISLFLSTALFLCSCSDIKKTDSPVLSEESSSFISSETVTSTEELISSETATSTEPSSSETATSTDEPSSSETESSPCAHSYGRTVIPSTCEKAGREDYRCTLCDHAYSVSLEKLPHSYLHGVCTLCKGSLLPTEYTKNVSVPLYKTAQNKNPSQVNAFGGLSTATLSQNSGNQRVRDADGTVYTFFLKERESVWANEISLSYNYLPLKADLERIGVYYSDDGRGWEKIEYEIRHNKGNLVFCFAYPVKATYFMLHAKEPTSQINCNFLSESFYSVYDPAGKTNDSEIIDPEMSRPIKIYVDQGHNMSGYVNSGAQGNGLDEGRVTFDVGYALYVLLNDDPRFEVILSRKTADTVLGTSTSESLNMRCAEANAFGADYFISIHCNAASDPSAHGTEVYAYSATGEGYVLGTSVLNALIEKTGYRDRGMKTNPSLAVLKNTAMPAILVELGFISNASDAALMKSDPAFFAEAIYSGITEYCF